jgi:lipoyl(octanoyl) transferase
MNWHLINSEFKTGQYNMDFDLELARSCSLNDAYLRFYRWEPYCISLGANQKQEEVDAEKCKSDKIDIVRRPTGGRAILHAEEITYSVVLPLTGEKTPREIYSKISHALAAGLRSYDKGLSEIELESAQPNFPALLKQPSGMLCFASTAKSELKYAGKKIVGSAQRKLDKVILQHGSILCGKFHRKLPEYLVESDENKLLLKNELEEKTIEIETILNRATDYKKLVDSLILGFEKEWQVNFPVAERL